MHVDPELKRNVPDRTKYNPASFVLPATDIQGHSERAFCRMMPEVYGAMLAVKDSKRFPFRTVGDVMRWCIHRGLKELERLEPDQGFMSRADFIIEVCRQSQQKKKYDDMFEALSETVNWHVSSGDAGKKEATRLLSQARSDIQKIAEPHWKAKCLEEYDRRFNHLTKDLERVKLV